MINASPHQYRNGGRAFGRSDALIHNALSQAHLVERNLAPSILTLRHLAHRMDVDYKFLRRVITDVESEFYRDFRIRKRSGGQRQIVVPSPRLMAVQRWISREILSTQPVHKISHAYSKHSSIFECARRHVGAGWLIKLDIHDFFESISDRRVYGAFRAIGYQPLVAFELARICTRVWVKPPNEFDLSVAVPNAARRGIVAYQRRYTGYLPQGAPTSPMLSNLVSRNLDADLSDLAMSEGMVVTRYSDDITLSAPSDGFSRDRAGPLVWRVREILLRHQFVLHEKKIVISPPGTRKIVLGLLVDGDRPRLTKAMRSRIADHVRGVDRFGLLAHQIERKFDALSGMVAHIRGLIRFAHDIDSDFAKPLSATFQAALIRDGWSPPF